MRYVPGGTRSKNGYSRSAAVQYNYTVTPLSEKRGVTFCQKNSLFTAEKMPRRDALVMLEEIPTP